MKMDNSTDIISIIIPAYNVEKYISLCLDSVIQQTYDNLNIIVVDDGSIDSTPRIIDEYAAKDKRIVAIHKKNGGLSDARNAGLERAIVNYLMFLDSDDWLEKKCCEIVLNEIRKEQADIVIFEYFKEYKNKTIKIKNYKSSKLVYENGNEEDFFLYDMRTITAWGKLYRTTLLKKLKFDINFRMAEDVDFNYKVYDMVNKAVYIDRPLLHYRILDVSAVHGFDPCLRDKFSPVLISVKKWAACDKLDKKKAYYSFSAIAFLLLCQNWITLNESFSFSQKKHEAMILKNDPIFKELFYNIKLIQIPMSRKLMIILGKYNLWSIFFEIINVKKILERRR